MKGVIFSRANLTGAQARKFRTLSEFSAFVDPQMAPMTQMRAPVRRATFGGRQA
jgi:hypothetical protein